MNNSIILEDTTLRDGEQMPGIAFDIQTKLDMVERLEAIGVRWIEVGIPAMGGDELKALRQMLERPSTAHLVAWNRGNRTDIRQSIDLGFKAIHIGLPTSDILLKHSVQKSREWLCRTAVDLVKEAKDRGVFVSISAEDVGRADENFLMEYAAAVSNAGADRLRVSDTVGIMTPARYGGLIAKLRSAASVDLQCHNHNDFGLGLANMLAGLAAGARYFHVTVGGIGERAGLPDMAQAVMALRLLHQVDLRIKCELLQEITAFVMEKVKVQLPPWTPIVGRNAFAHESGIHVNAILRDPSTFEALDPATLGRQRSFVLGKHSGKAAVESALAHLGCAASEIEVQRILERVRQFSIDHGRPVESADLRIIHREVTAVYETATR